MKQIFSFGLTAALLLACLTGCGGQAGRRRARRDNSLRRPDSPGVLRSGNARR